MFTEPRQFIPPDADDETLLSEPTPDAGPTLSRRQFLLRNLALLGAWGVGEGLREPGEIQVTRHQVPIRGLRAPLRAAQLSDLHRSWCVPEGFIRQVVARTNALDPDLVLLTGDYVTRSSAYAASCVRHLADLRAPLGLYGVLGNHDYHCDHGQGAPIVTDALLSIDVRILINRSERLDNGLCLVGIDDFHAGKPDVPLAFADVRPGEPVFAMTHNPGIFPKVCRRDCVVLAGHLHGGQINFPLLTRCAMGRDARYLKGWHREPQRPGRMYVSRGLGVVYVPMRFRSVPEIALFDLIPA